MVENIRSQVKSSQEEAVDISETAANSQVFGRIGS